MKVSKEYIIDGNVVEKVAVFEDIEVFSFTDVDEDTYMSQCDDTPKDVTPNYYAKWYKGVKLDPYRIAQVYEIGGGPQEQVLKKTLRGCHKGHEALQVIKEIRQALDRWEEMLEEDSLTTSQRGTEEK